MMSNFPTTKFTMHLYFLPDPEIVLALPPMESLHIKDCSVGVSSFLANLSLKTPP